MRPSASAPALVADARITVQPDDGYGHLSSGRAKAAVNGVLWSSLNTGFPFALGLLVFVLTSRVLSPEDFGLVALASSVAIFAAALAPGAFAEALVQRSKINGIHVDTIFWLCVGAGVLLTVAIILAAPLIAGWLGQNSIVQVIQVFAFKVTFDLFGAVPNALIVRAMKFRLVALRTVIASVLSATVCLGLLFSGFGLWALVASHMTASLVVMVTAFWTAGYRPRLRFAPSNLRELARYGIFASGSQMVGTMNIDQLMIGSMAGPVALGLYNFARRLLTMINSVLAGTLSSVSHSLFASLQNEQAKVREAFLLAVFISLGVSCPIFVGLAWISPELIPLVFSDKWNAAIVPVQALCAVGVIASVGLVQASLISSQGRTDWWFYYQTAQQAGTFAIIVFLHHHGIGVIVVAIAVKTMLLWPISLFMSARLTGATVAEYILPTVPPLLGTGVMIGVLFLVGPTVTELDVVTRLTLQIIIGGFVYLLVAGTLSWRRVRNVISIIRPNESASS